MHAQDRSVSRPSPQQLRVLLEPRDEPRPERASDYIHRYARRYVFDPRTILFDVRACCVEGEVFLEGLVGVCGLREGLIKSLSALGLTVRADALKVVPAGSGDHDRYSVLAVPHSYLQAKPSSDSERSDEVLLGEPILLLGERANGFCLAQASSGYIGWIKEGDVRVVDRATWRLWHGDERVIFDRPVQVRGFLVPSGAELPVQAGQLLLPDETSAPIPTGLRHLEAERIRVIREKILSRAEEFLGRKYVWAGKGGEGVDCSGFVHMVYASLGVYLPRDADQQHLVGRVSGMPEWREDLAAGDLLFFAGPMGNIVHVALSRGGREFIHAKGEYYVTKGSFDPESQDYAQVLERSFIVGKRVITGYL